jgi:LmbE family N-acetylglucosaminyl deacetylase
MNVLAIGAHHDDIELGAGGTLARLAAEGNRVYGLTLTNSATDYAIKSIHRTTDAALQEARAAAKVIGLELLETPDEFAKDNGMLVYDTHYMRFVEQVLHDKKIDCVFTHWQYDMNTDHEAAAKVSIVASRHIKKVLMYRSNWYQPDRAFNGIFYFDISAHIETKIRALNAYSGEIKNRGQDWINSFIDSNRAFGFSLGVKYAEVFEPIRYSV